MRKIVLVVIVVLLLAGGGFGWYYFQGPCGVNLVNASIDDLQAQIEEFDDASNLANNTPRISLSGPLNEMQSIRRDTNDVVVPACLETAKDLLTGGMQNYIQAFIAFSGQESDNTVKSYFVDGNQQFSVFADELERVSDCAPFCKEDPYRVTP